MTLNSAFGWLMGVYHGRSPWKFVLQFNKPWKFPPFSGQRFTRVISQWGKNRQIERTPQNMSTLYSGIGELIWYDHYGQYRWTSVNWPPLKFWDIEFPASDVHLSSPQEQTRHSKTSNLTYHHRASSYWLLRRGDLCLAPLISPSLMSIIPWHAAATKSKLQAWRTMSYVNVHPALTTQQYR